MATPYAAIPEPKQDIASLYATVLALKQTLETVIGLRGMRGAKNQVFVVRASTGADIPVGVSDGDLWIQPAVIPTDTWGLSTWKDGQWQKIPL